MNRGRTIKMWIGNILLKYAKWQRKHWFLSLLFIRLLAIWFSFIVTYAGEWLRFIKVVADGKKQFTIFGLICTIALLVIVIIGEVALKYEHDKDQNKHDNGAAFILRNLRDATYSLCEAKYKTLISEIDKIKNTLGSSIPEIVSNPEKQLDELSSQLVSCLCTLLQEDKGEKWREDDVFVSIAYEYPSDAPNVWHWATKERGLSLDKLFEENDNEPISTMLHCLKSKSSNVFFNSKQKALEEKHYVPDQGDEYDSDGKLLGSIACYEDTIKKNDVVYIHYVLTISTYDKKFVSIDAKSFETPEEANKVCREAEDAAKFNMQKNIVRDFFARTRVELCLLYLAMLKAKSAASKE